MARELRILVTAETAQAKRELGEVEKSTKGVTTATADMDKQMAHATGTMSAAQMAAVGLAAAFVVQNVVRFGKEILNFADRMQDLSAQTDIGAETLQQLDYVALGMGTTVEKLAESFAKLSARLAGNDPSAVKGMEMLGLNVEKFLALSPEQRIFAVADAAGKLGDQTQRNQALFALFGRQFLELTPLMTAKLRELANHAPIISEDEIASIARFHDLIDQGSRTLMVWTVNAFEAAKMAFLMNEQATEIERLEKSTAKFVTTQAEQLDIYHKLVPPLKDYTLSGVDLKIVTEDLNAKVKASIQSQEAAAKAHEKAALAVTQQAAAYRQFTNFIEERLIENVAMQIKETERLRDELNKIETTITADYLGQLQARNQATQDGLDDQEAAWRQHTNMVGELLMEQDALAMQSTMTMGQYFAEMFAGIGQGVGQLLGMIGDALGPRFYGIMRNFQDAWHAGRSVVQGVLKGLAGDFSGWLQVIMSGISLVRSAWGALQKLFGGGEEGTTVNPARDTFLSQWGDPSNKGEGGAGHNLAALMTSLGAGEGGGGMFGALQGADTMALFRPAAQAIVEFLTSKGESAVMNFAAGGMVPMTGMANVHQGEGVLTARGVAAAGGPSGVDALNSGAGWSGLAARIDRLGERLEAQSVRQAALIPLLARDAALKALA